MEKIEDVAFEHYSVLLKKPSETIHLKISRPVSYLLNIDNDLFRVLDILIVV